MTAVFKTMGGKNPVRESTLSFAPGDCIFQHGELGTEMYIIQEGEVHIVRKLGSESHVLSRLERGDFFGEMAVLESVPRSADAIAITHVRLLVINGSRFDEMLRRNPEVAVRIIRKYSQRLREANTLLDRMAGHEVDTDNTSPDSTLIAPPELSLRQRLVEPASQRQFYLTTADETTIGRADPVTGILPDIDLTALDSNRSVSRRHAKIIRNGSEFMVLEEVGTVNGTFINDQRIPTGMPVHIRNGDIVKIGLIPLSVVLD